MNISSPAACRLTPSGVSVAHVAQLVEHVLGKDGVSSSNLLVGSNVYYSGGRRRGTVVRSPRTPHEVETPNIGDCGSNSGVESQPSKLLVAGSNPVSRSM